MSAIGKSIKRIDVREKVTGEADYPGDINKFNQAHMKILFAGRPHAVIRDIDITEALLLEGVIAVFTAKDVPNNEYGLGEPDQPVLCGPGSNKPFADHVRFIGDQVATVVAETTEIAAKAVSMIKVDYQDLAIVSDPLEARRPEAQLVHPDLETNVFTEFKIRKGDVKTAFSKADVIIEGEYHTPVQEHAYLQPEAGLAYIDEDGRVTVIVAGQWAHEDQEQIAHSLDLPEDQVRVIYPAIGGAFGGREDMSVQIVLALAAWKLHQRGIHRPVKTVWSREESIIGHHKRHAYTFKTRWGAAKNGKLLAAEFEIIADGGAYSYTSPKVLGNATLMCTGPYEIPNVKVDSCAVYTNNIPGGAFRGFGSPQGAFAAETQMNKLAEALGLDPIEIRMRNIVREGSILSVGTPLPKGVSMPYVVEACAKSANWRHKAVTSKGSLDVMARGRGFACGFKNVGFSFGYQENCTATVELHGGAEINKAVIRHAAAEVGQGTHTAIVQMVAGAIGIDPGHVEWDFSDTNSSENSGSVSASRMTFMAGNSVKGAVDAALKKWHNEERPAIATFKYLAPKTTAFEPETGQADPNFSYGYVAQVVDLEVDTQTGMVRIIDVISVNDVGKAINPQQVEGQTEGAIVQAAGYALMENFLQKDGYVQTSHFSTYLIPTVLDIPGRVETVILEYPDPNGPWGARGMGEMPFIPLTPAITAAIHDATGVWFNDFPLTPERVLRGLGKI
ncbi:MAG: molybdopterin-dependent oxidoreductase [Anaerolineales bacterium]|nr:molybdopterin-dependent oxidoreductase [Anaerolineales bacterium]